MSKPGFITVGEIGRRLGVKVDVAFITETLGVEGDDKDKRSTLWREDRFSEICDAFVTHVNGCREVNYDDEL